MKRGLYILNDCMRKFTYERTAGRLLRTGAASFPLKWN